MAKITKTQQWELDHPDDVPCPRGAPDDYQARRAAREWRKARGIILEPATRKRLERYAAAMAEPRATRRTA